MALGKEGKGHRTARATIPGAVSVPVIEEPEAAPRAPAPPQDTTPENGRRHVKAVFPGAVAVAAEEPESAVSNGARQSAQNTKENSEETGEIEMEEGTADLQHVQYVTEEVTEDHQSMRVELGKLEYDIEAKHRAAGAGAVTPGAVSVDSVAAIVAAEEDGTAKKTAGSGATGVTPAAQSITSNEIQESIALRKDPRARHRRRSRNAAAAQKAAVAGAIVAGAAAAGANSAPSPALDDAENRRRVAPFQPDLEPTAGAISPADSDAVPLVTTAARGVGVAPDLEYGTTVYGGPGRSALLANDALCVAIAVNEGDEDIFLPAAVEYDPDAKPPLLKNRRFLLYAISAVLLFIVVIIVLILGLVVFRQDPPPPATYAPTRAPSVAPSSSLEGQYRDQFIAAVGPMVSVPNSPQERAARWIIEEDERNLAVDDPSLVQRYILALFYFTTTNNEEYLWRSCNPHPTDSSNTTCEYQELTRLPDDSIGFMPKPSFRWLSNEHECDWAGNLCDDNKVIHALELCK